MSFVPRGRIVKNSIQRRKIIMLKARGWCVPACVRVCLIKLSVLFIEGALPQVRSFLTLLQ